MKWIRDLKNNNCSLLKNKKICYSLRENWFKHRPKKHSNSWTRWTDLKQTSIIDLLITRPKLMLLLLTIQFKQIRFSFNNNKGEKALIMQTNMQLIVKSTSITMILESRVSLQWARVKMPIRLFPRSTSANNNLHSRQEMPRHSIMTMLDQVSFLKLKNLIKPMTTDQAKLLLIILLILL
jgi:hypothetical protein